MQLILAVFYELTYRLIKGWCGWLGTSLFVKLWKWSFIYISLHSLLKSPTYMYYLWIIWLSGLFFLANKYLLWMIWQDSFYHSLTLGELTRVHEYNFDHPGQFFILNLSSLFILWFFLFEFIYNSCQNICFILFYVVCKKMDFFESLCLVSGVLLFG